MSIAAMGELEKRQRLREEAVQRRPGEFCYPLDSEGEWTAAEERQTLAKGNKRKMVGREEEEAKRRRMDKEAGVVVKCSQEQGKGSKGKGMDRSKKETSFPSLKRKIGGREEEEAKRRRIDKEAGVVVKCSQEQEQGKGSEGKGMDRSKKETSFPSLKRKIGGREEVEAKRRRMDTEAGVVVKCSQEQGMDRSKKDLSLTSLKKKKKKIAVREEAEAKKRIEGEDEAAVTGMERRKKETSFPSLKRKRIAERDEAEATKRISLSSDSCSHDRVSSSNNGSSCRGQADGDAALVSSLHSIGVPRGKRTHLEVS